MVVLSKPLSLIPVMALSLEKKNLLRNRKAYCKTMLKTCKKINGKNVVNFD